MNNNTEAEVFSLNQNDPNPFKPSTNISFNTPSLGSVKLKVCNSLGQEVATLVNQNMNAGAHQVNFEAGNLTSGIYYYQLSTGNQRITRKMTLLKKSIKGFAFRDAELFYFK